MTTRSREEILARIKKDAEYNADNIRNAHRLGDRDIGDIFRFMEQSLGYLLVRYPFGEDALEGFAALFQGEQLVVTNSSSILPRERFTAAHEIGHHVFDFSNGSQLRADQKTGSFNDGDLSEYRADCFAAALLMPEKGVKDTLYELGLDQSDLSHTDVVRLQLVFGVSYRAMVKRLEDLGRIDRAKAAYLYNYHGETGENLPSLFRRAQAPSTVLLEAWRQVWVPTRYLRCLEANYEGGLVSYPVLQQILQVVGVTPEDWDFAPKTEGDMFDDHDVDIDDLIEELAHED